MPCGSVKGQAGKTTEFAERGGCNLSATDKASDCAAIWFQVLCLCLFALAQGARTALHLAAEHGHTKIAQLLLKQGASVEARTRVSVATSGCSPPRKVTRRLPGESMHPSAQFSISSATGGVAGESHLGRPSPTCGSFDFRGAQLGETALMLALDGYHYRLAGSLAKRGADPEAKDNVCPTTSV